MEFSSTERLQGASLPDNGLRAEKRFLPDKTGAGGRAAILFQSKESTMGSSRTFASSFFCEVIRNSMVMDNLERAQSPLRLLNAVVCRPPNSV